MGSKLHCRHFGELLNPALGRGIGNELRECELIAARANIDNCTTLADIDHPLGGSLRVEKTAFHIGADHIVPAFLGKLQ
ncbi:hypothetical protein D9M68_968880 [compost metagenome]